jgi:hypothetical protein
MSNATMAMRPTSSPNLPKAALGRKNIIPDLPL